MRIGTTSYIYPADILPNVRRLADQVDDIELVLFEVDDQNNLPNKHTTNELIQLAADHELTFTVHLPLDLRLANDDNTFSIEKALKVVGHTEKLNPYGYVIHIETDDELAPNGMSHRHAVNSLKALDRIADATGSFEYICLENLESQPDQFLQPILDAAPVSRCVDIGHLWKQGVDPVPHLLKWLTRTRIIHLHGVSTRDHTSLSVMPAESIDDVTSVLFNNFDGVITLEVFSEHSFLSSLEALDQSRDRLKNAYSEPSC
jgi:sugar phosphate isomerase/epimerase